MKKSNELVDLSVVSIEDGAEIGKVKALVIDPKKSEITALVIRDDLWYKEAKIISYALIYGIGEYAITIENTSVVVSLSSIPEIERLLQARFAAKGCKVITKMGRLIGELKEYFIDTRNGRIIAYEISPQYIEGESEQVIVPAQAVITIGKDVIIVVDNVEEYFEERIEEIKEVVKEEIVRVPTIEEISVKKEIIEKKEEIEPEQEIKVIEEIKIEPKIEVIEEIPTPPVEVKEEIKEETAKPVPDVSKLFEERQKKFVLGKIVSKKIEDSVGNVIANEGDIITEKIIEIAKKSGKFMELSLNVKPS